MNTQEYETKLKMLEKTLEEQQVDFYYMPKAKEDLVQASDKEQQTDKSSDNTSGTK